MQVSMVMIGKKMKNLIKKFLTLLTLSSILLPQFSLAANTYTVDLERGSSQYFTAADSADLSQTGSQTWQFWINFESEPTDGQEFHIFNHQAAGQQAFRLLYQNNAADLEFTGFISSDCTNVTEFHNNFDPTVDTWYHVAFVYSTAGTLEFFLNGVSQNSTAGLPTSMCDSTQTFYIGARNDGSNTFDGKIDDLRIYSIARTGTQILADDDCELSTYTSLVGYWQFNNAATEVAGVGANTNNLTEVNTPTYQSASLPFTGDCGGGVLPHPLWWTPF